MVVYIFYGFKVNFINIVKARPEMEIAYVIVPYRSKTGENTLDQVVALTEELWSLGYVTLCPILNHAKYNTAIPEIAYIEGFIARLSTANFAITTRGWEDDDGSKSEVDYCKNNNMPLYHSIAELIEDK